MGADPTFGDLLATYLMERDRSSAWLANRIGMHPASVSRWLSGASRPGNLVTILQIADALLPLDRADRQRLVHTAGYAYPELEPSAPGLTPVDPTPRAPHPNPYPLVQLQPSHLPVQTARTHVPPPVLTPPLPPQGVIGRAEFLSELTALLALEDHTATDVAPVALRGMGGIGKTTLAIALGHMECIPRLFPDGVLWVALGPTPTVRLALQGWGQGLGVNLLAERDEHACRDRLRTLLHPQRVLLIIDDVWQVGQGQAFTLGGPHCRTLLTTRESHIAHDLVTRARTLRVDLLKPQAALALLRQLAPEAVAADEKSARRLCERLEFLPLALTLAGRLLANEADVPVRMQRLLHELVERRAAALQLTQVEGRLGLQEHEPVSIKSILGMSVDLLDSIDQERFAMASVFGGEPLTWDTRAAAFVWQCSVAEAEATTSRFLQRGLVEWRREADHYWMHTLLADYAAELMQEKGL